MNTPSLNCHICGWKFHSFRDFKEHVVDTHSVKWIKTIPEHRPDIAPCKMTDRTKSEIVRDAEAQWPEGLLI